MENVSSWECRLSVYLSLSAPACVDSAAGVSASFGEMLLLVAMYFHSNQLSSIIELVCSTLGMKVRQWEGESSQYISVDVQALAWLLHWSKGTYRD